MKKLDLLRILFQIPAIISTVETFTDRDSTGAEKEAEAIKLLESANEAYAIVKTPAIDAGIKAAISATVQLLHAFGIFTRKRSKATDNPDLRKELSK